MKGWLTVSEAARRWRVSPQRVRQFLSEGRIPAAVRIGTMWLIPSSTLKPLRDSKA